MPTESQRKAATEIRDATSSDLESIRAIYNHYVATTTVTFDTSEQSADVRREWFEHHKKEQLPVLVAEMNGVVVGWASLSYYNSKCAYRTSVEPSVYIHQDYQRQGLGRQLTNAIVSAARQRRYHCLVGLVCSENIASLNMMDALGFERVGELKEVGRKFDRWLNVFIVQKVLNS